MNESQRQVRAVGTMGAATFASRILGLVREIVYAGLLGQSFAASAFFYAFSIPNLFRRLLGEGALTAAFIPIFSRKLSEEGSESAAHTAHVVASMLLTVCAGIAAAAIAGLEGAKLVAVSDRWRTILTLTQVMLPYMIFANLAALGMAILNVRGRFFVPALSPVLLNAVMIGAALLSHRIFGSDARRLVLGLAVGVLVGGALQWLYQQPSLRRAGFPPRWNFAPRDPVLKQIALLMLPAVLGTAVYQVNVLVSGTLAFWVGDYARAALNYADRLMEFPMGVFGVSVATYALPAMASRATQNKMSEYKAALLAALQLNFFLTIPSAVGLATLAHPIVRLLFEHGRFDAAATEHAAFALQFLAGGLIAYSAVNILARAFYALQDTRTPMNISVVAMLLNIPLTVLLMQPLGVGGIALANTLSSALNALALAFALRRRIGVLDSKWLTVSALKICTAAALMGAVAWFSHSGLDARFGHAALGARLLTTVVSIGLAAIAYFAAAAVLRIEQIGAIRSAFGRRNLRQTK